MPFGLAQFQETQPLVQETAFLNANGIAAAAILANLSGPYRVDMVLATNGDAVDHVIDLYIRISGVNYPIGSVSVPAGSGFGGVPSVDILAGALPAGSAGLPLIDGATLYASMEVAITAPNQVTITALGGVL
jgi:hypothetical protein